MLTSNNQSNQYLRPDYLAPMTNPLDAKNSPLALLAQTCSAIGTDAPNPKLVANAEKNSKSMKLSINDSRDKASPSSNSTLSNGSSSDIVQQKSSFKPYESSVLIQQPSHQHHIHHQQLQQQQQHQSRTSVSPAEDRPLSASYRIKTPKKSLTPSSQQQNGRCESNQSSTSQRASPDAKTPLSSSGNRDNNNSSPKRASSKESPTSAPINMSLESPLYNSFKLSEQSSRSDMSNYVKTSSSSSVPITSASPYFSGYTGAPSGLPYSMDLMTASALMSSPHHQSMFKAASMNPYFNYSRLKVPGDPMAGVCRDPYCTGCALSPHMMNKASSAPCPAGCTQCDHTSAKSYASQLSAAQGSVAAAYAHAQLVAFAAASQMPYLCNWISGDAAYCGKRFGTSDELLQHLRTHTSAMPESMLNPAMAGLPPTHPLFQRTYPTPPLSPLSTARYHPYGKPSLLPPSLMPPTSLAGISMHNPSLAQYMSPYSLYGPRIGQSHP